MIALAAQIELLRQRKKPGVLITPGSPMPELPRNMCVTNTDAGLVVHDGRWTDFMIRSAAKDGTLGEMLGYGVASKPDKPAGAVVVRAANGHEMLSVVVAEEDVETVLNAQKATWPGRTVQFEPLDRVVEDRERDLTRHEIHVWPIQDEATRLRVIAAAKAEDHYPINPTHWMERDGLVVGYLAINSLPLFTIWLQSGTVHARDTVQLWHTITNHYRMAGAKVVATSINRDSPFYRAKERLGLKELPNEVVCLKEL
jgi:hypothetical protein